MANKTASVWGSPGSGKTVTTVKIAKALAQKKQNVIIVGCDSKVPLLPLLLPEAQDTPSLGELLTADRISQVDILRHCVPYGKNQYISLLGYRRGENIMSYPKYSFYRAAELIDYLRQLHDDFVLIDCSSDLDDCLAAAALKLADVTFRVVNADLKSLLYFKSTAPLLMRDSGYRYSNQINVLNNVLQSQDTDPVKEALGEESHILPNVPELKEQYDSASLMDTVFGKTARQYTMAINKLVKEELLSEPGHGIIHGRKTADHISGTA